MTIGDYILCISMTLNASMALAYGIQGQGWRGLYWACCFGLNLCLLNLKG